MSDPPSGDWHGDEVSSRIITDREKALVLSVKRETLGMVLGLIRAGMAMELPPNMPPNMPPKSMLEAMAHGIQDALDQVK